MAPNTSPSFVITSSRLWEAAYQSNTGYLYVTGTNGTVNPNLPMAPGTSPALLYVAA